MSLNYINLGCGSHFHPDWVNLDYAKTSKNVIAHNLNKGIPFPDNTFEVVYHSHVLEHFSQKNAVHFMEECYRVLKNNGIIRIAIPDLEQIINEYKKQLEKAKNGEELADLNYQWIMMELFDQTVRNQSGGEMAKFLCQENLQNEAFILQRIGSEAKRTIDLCSNHQMRQGNKAKPKLKYTSTIKCYAKNVLRLILGEKLLNYILIGRFRESGEIHQWMYDQYSISLLLKQCGFHNISLKTAYESDIPEFSKYNLDVVNGGIRKPDSLFVEAYK